VRAKVRKISGTRILIDRLVSELYPALAAECERLQARPAPRWRPCVQRCGSMTTQTSGDPETTTHRLHNLDARRPGRRRGGGRARKGAEE